MALTSMTFNPNISNNFEDVAELNDYFKTIPLQPVDPLYVAVKIPRLSNVIPVIAKRRFDPRDFSHIIRFSWFLVTTDIDWIAHQSCLHTCNRDGFGLLENICEAYEVNCKDATFIRLEDISTKKPSEFCLGFIVRSDMLFPY